MLSIETQTQSMAEKSVAPSITQIDDDKPQDRETSFLTVYSDSDALVQADEVDPIAEADVYIAYGRDEQAEEVMMDGIVRMPDRVDIKQKLLTLYHKNNNKEGFERIAEELYAQKGLLTSEIWQQVSLMGKDISPENPLFDVSTADLLGCEVVMPTDMAAADSALHEEPIVDESAGDDVSMST
jgi:pilus assembly protein FimV